MLSKLVSIAKREDFQDLTGLTEKQIQLLFFLLFSDKQEFTYGQLKKSIKSTLNISFNDKTLSRSLSKLEEKQIITWIRAEKFQRNESSTIFLNEIKTGEKIGIQKQAREMLREFENVKNNAKIMSEKDITNELIELAKNQAGASLYLRLLHIKGTFDEIQTSFGLILSQIFFESNQELYINEIKGRDEKSMNAVLEYFLNSGIEI